MIDLVLDDEQQALVHAVGAFLGKEPTGAGDKYWLRAAELGWIGIGVPEDRGGGGAGVAAQALVFREVGRALAPGPWLGTVVAAAVATDSPLAGRFAAGTATAVIGQIDDATGRRVVHDDGSGDGSSDMVVFLDRPGGLAYLGDRASLPCGAAGLTVDPGYRVQVVDPRFDLERWAVVAVAVERVASLGRVLCAAMASGIAERTRDASVEYATTRVQYGRPIGSFQAVKHRCADMAVRAYAAWNLTAVAALRLEAEQPAGPETAAAAKLVAADAAVRNAADNLQNHGAIGFTAEHGAHRHVTRAAVLEHLFGTPRALVPDLTAPRSLW